MTEDPGVLDPLRSTRVKPEGREATMAAIRERFESLGPVVLLENYATEEEGYGTDVLFNQRPEPDLEAKVFAETWREIYQLLHGAIGAFNSGDLTVNDLLTIMDLALDYNYEPVTFEPRGPSMFRTPEDGDPLKNINQMVLRAVEKQLEGRKPAQFFERKLRKDEKATVRVHRLDEDEPLGVLKNYLNGNCEARGWPEAVAAMIYELDLVDQPFAIRMLWNRRAEIKTQRGDEALAIFFSFEGMAQHKSTVLDKLKAAAKEGFRSGILSEVVGPDGEVLFPFLDPLRAYRSVPDNSPLGMARQVIEDNVTSIGENKLLDVNTIAILPTAEILEVIYRIAHWENPEGAQWCFAQMASIYAVRIKSKISKCPEPEKAAIRDFYLKLHYAGKLKNSDYTALRNIDSACFAFANAPVIFG